MATIDKHVAVHIVPGQDCMQVVLSAKEKVLDEVYFIVILALAHNIACHFIETAIMKVVSATQIHLHFSVIRPMSGKANLFK